MSAEEPGVGNAAVNVGRAGWEQHCRQQGWGCCRHLRGLWGWWKHTGRTAEGKEELQKSVWNDCLLSYLNSPQMGLPQDVTWWWQQMSTVGEAEPGLRRLAKNSKAEQTIASKTVLDRFVPVLPCSYTIFSCSWYLLSSKVNIPRWEVRDILLSHYCHLFQIQ